MLTLKQIDYALAVAKNLHFKKAADECFISASTMSNAITELEAHLGVKIFERSNKKVIVTNLGQEILTKAKKIKLEVHNIHELAQHHSRGLGQFISIGIIPTISPYFLPMILAVKLYDSPNSFNPHRLCLSKNYSIKHDYNKT